uniref:Interferon regulatory factor 7 n=1 Tax=Malurus cyaneus samueli TaxID=2593467 RepID=A0A8C5TI82_9PASS
ALPGCCPRGGPAQKLRFGQWLLNAINSGNYRGLRWIDPARTTFRVPWKHNARKDITSSDLEVFKGWAKASGRYEEGFEDPAKWKTNFRCALSSTHLFNLEEDNSKRGDDPHKVFSVHLHKGDFPAGDTPHQDIVFQLHQDTLLQPHQDTLLDVTIYYRGKLFHQEEVGGSHCLLTYQPCSLPQAPCPLHVVHFPSPAGMADRKQRRITEKLLRVAGLQLEQRAQKVFATRREKCKVFWALSQQLEGVEEPPPNLLCRDQETPIFDFREFCTELRDFRNGQRRRSPDFTIYLCFGQAFSKAKPKESKLILVKLVPKLCEYFYEQVLQEGASSLDSRSISLQLSKSFDLMELIEQYNMQLG